MNIFEGGNVLTRVMFRELPGFGSTRLLLSTVSQELDCWRALIEDLVLQSFETYESISMTLTDRLTAQVIPLILIVCTLAKLITFSLIVSISKQRNQEYVEFEY